MTLYVPEDYAPPKPTCCAGTSPTSTGPSSPSSTCPRSSRGRCSPATAAARRACAGCSSTSSSATSTSSGDHSVDATVGLQRAEELYEKVFVEYGDDSVAQLGGVHLACEQASNILTKILEWGRLMSYLEQSTRYIAYDTRLGGRYRFYRDPAVLASRLGTRYVGDMDRMFDAYSEVVNKVTDHVRATVPSRPTTATSSTARPPGPRRSTPRAACCRRRRSRTSASTAPARRSRRCCCACAPTRSPRPARYADLMLARAAQGHPELPAPGRPPRARWTMERLPGDAREPTPPTSSTPLFGGDTGRHRARCTLVDFDPDAEDKLLAAICYPHTDLPETPAARPGAHARHRRAGGAAPRLRRRPREPAPQAGPGLRAHRLPLRRALRLRRVPRPAAAPHAHDRVAAAHARTTATCAPTSSTRPARADVFDDAMAPLGRPLRRLHRRLPRTGRLRRGHGLPAALRDAVQRPRGDAHARAALERRRATRRTAGSPSRCTG